ncbi:MAG: bifunctional 3,4-dihydroxy-2-butanone-4-phosphate synthase/GTP cyclohydrolase II [Actinobacteria bacterium]|nr:bifunctional 3,4-dihydroxy-2-butanone-4-phosphate synthase/GTP cyclohydrolase II [Actinomycetota bacterium]
MHEGRRGFARVTAAVRALERGGMVVVVDAADRENEGDLVMAADRITPEAVNFMATHGRGLICVAMLEERLRALGIGTMVDRSTDPRGTAFFVSVDHARDATTGISASDRSKTIRALADPAAMPVDFNQPGHVFPLGYQEGGVLRRAGHTEASVDLAVLAGRQPAAVICEIARPDGEMARLPELEELARLHGLPLVTIAELIEYRRREAPLIQRVSATNLPLEQGHFRAIGYRDAVHGREHLALTVGDLGALGGVPPLVRMHSECLTGDVFGSHRCDCGAQLEKSLEMIAAEGRGAVIYLIGHEGRGIGLTAKLAAYELQEQGLDTFDANVRLGHPPDARDYSVGMAILSDLGLQEVRLLTNNPAKRSGLETYGIEVTETVPLRTTPTPDNLRYLRTKQHRMGHLDLALSDTYGSSSATESFAAWACLDSL